MTETGDVIVRESGLLIPVPPEPQRAWVKLAGEPALILYESPAEFIKLWLEFKAGAAPALIVHDHAFGKPVAFLREAVIAFIGVTYPTAAQHKTEPGSIWLGKCPCAEFGGRCPPL